MLFCILVFAKLVIFYSYFISRITSNAEVEVASGIMELFCKLCCLSCDNCGDCDDCGNCGDCEVCGDCDNCGDCDDCGDW